MKSVETKFKLRSIIISMSLMVGRGKNGIADWLNRNDIFLAQWMDTHCQIMMRISLALIFIWFGALKLLGVSPEIELIKRTVYWFPPEFITFILGWWEVAIGVGLLFRPLIRVALLLLIVQLSGTFLPLILSPQICFSEFPFVLTLEGQYIVKNLFLVGAAFVVGGKVRYHAAVS